VFNKIRANTETLNNERFNVDGVVEKLCIEPSKEYQAAVSRRFIRASS
jgi:hypothetical protein